MVAATVNVVGWARPRRAVQRARLCARRSRRARRRWRGIVLRGSGWPGAFFEVSDGELDCGVAAVVCVGGDGVEVVSVGDEAVVAPVGPSSPWAPSRRLRRMTRRSLAGLASGPRSLSPRRPGSSLSHLAARV